MQTVVRRSVRMRQSGVLTIAARKLEQDVSNALHRADDRAPPVARPPRRLRIRSVARVTILSRDALTSDAPREHESLHPVRIRQPVSTDAPARFLEIDEPSFYAVLVRERACVILSSRIDTDQLGVGNEAVIRFGMNLGR
jgi:hypothetical protein